jgi:hypothetical protein
LINGVLIANLNIHRSTRTPRMRWLLLPLLLVSGAAQAQMSLHPGDGFENCPTAAYPNLSIASWNNTFGAFPQTGVSRISISGNGGVSLAFTAPGAALSGQFQALQSLPINGESVIAMSACAGAYPQLPAACLSAVAESPTLDWTTDANGTGCLLQPGQLYYLNLSFGNANAPGAGEPWCGTPGSCGLSLQSSTR